MKVDSDPMDVLSNQEVLSWLRETRASRLSQLRVRQHRVCGPNVVGAAVKGESTQMGGDSMTASPSSVMRWRVNTDNVLVTQNQAVLYLERTTAFEQKPAEIMELTEKLKKYDLAPAELLMVLNLRPTQPAQLMPILEDCLDRFTTETMEEIVELVSELLPPAPEPQDDGDEEYKEEAKEEVGIEVEEAEEEAMEEEAMEEDGAKQGAEMQNDTGGDQDPSPRQIGEGGEKAGDGPPGGGDDADDDADVEGFDDDLEREMDVDEDARIVDPNAAAGVVRRGADLEATAAAAAAAAIEPEESELIAVAAVRSRRGDDDGDQSD